MRAAGGAERQMDRDELLKPEEAAKLAKLSLRQVQDLAKLRDCPVLDFGTGSHGNYRFPRDRFLKWAEERANRRLPHVPPERLETVERFQRRRRGRPPKYPVPGRAFGG